MLRSFAVAAIAVLGLAAQPSFAEVLPEFDSRFAPAAIDLCALDEVQPGLDLAHSTRCESSGYRQSRELLPPVVEIPPSVEALIHRTSDLNPPRPPERAQPLVWF